MPALLISSVLQLLDVLLMPIDDILSLEQFELQLLQFFITGVEFFAHIGSNIRNTVSYSFTLLISRSI